MSACRPTLWCWWSAFSMDSGLHRNDMVDWESPYRSPV